MIYILSKKFFQKNIKKIAKATEYFIIDGENYAASSTNMYRSQEVISSKYARAKGIGSLSPERELDVLLSRVVKGEKVPEVRYKRNLENFFDDPQFLSAVGQVLMTAVLGIEKETSILVVIPDNIWKSIGDRYVNEFNKTINHNTNLVYSQKDLKTTWKILDSSIPIKIKDKLEARANELIIADLAENTDDLHDPGNGLSYSSKYGYDAW